MPRRSTNKARGLILDMARFGDHRHNIPTDATASGLDHWFTSNNYPFLRLVETLRDPSERVPFVENLLGPNWTTVGDPTSGVQFSVYDMETGQSLSSISGPGIQSLCTYHSQFDQAVESLERAIEHNSYQDLQQALGTGIASLETFVENRVRKWNAKNPSNQLVDTQPFKTFDDKVGDWFPIMSNGRRYDKGGADWDKLKRLREIRDNEAIHSKNHAQAVTFAQLADYCNWFTQGITETMFRMHVFFELRVPSSIIRAKYVPDVIVETSTTLPPVA